MPADLDVAEILARGAEAHAAFVAESQEMDAAWLADSMELSKVATLSQLDELLAKKLEQLKKDTDVDSTPAG